MWSIEFYSIDNLGKCVLCCKSNYLKSYYTITGGGVYNTPVRVSHIARRASDIYESFQWESEHKWLSINHGEQQIF